MNFSDIKSISSRFWEGGQEGKRYPPRVSVSFYSEKGAPGEKLNSDENNRSLARELSIHKELALGEHSSVIKIVDGIIEHAYAMRASDIHMDPGPKKMRVRFRVDGMLEDVHQIPNAVQTEIISRIKILSGLRTDEHQAAQDGRFRYQPEPAVNIDIRVSIVPAYYGEDVVMRLLSDRAEEFTLESLGFSAENGKKIAHAISRPYGMILATGPTGSGKTTTLYTILKSLNTKNVSVITIEDPIEYAIEGIEQIQVNSRTGLTFANGLRSILRQDPNIIMVGEIRDAETAGIAVNTALTGHLVLSTLHTNDAATTLPRLLDMKIESYLIASTVSVAIGQRLVRKICAHCKQQKKMSKAECENLRSLFLKEFFSLGSPVWYGKGCSWCNQSGYFGRIGVHEVLVPDNVIREAVLQKVSAGEIRKLAIAQGMVPMVEDGIGKVLAGLTTIEEIVRMHYE